MEAADLRASDADRDRAVSALRAHHEAGRLTVEELEERLACAYAARTWAALTALFTDLPGATPTRLPAPPAVPVRRPGRAGPFGRVGFTYSGTLPAAPELVAARAVQHLGPGLQSAGYQMTAESPRRVTFTAERIPGWAWGAAIMLPGPGLLALVFARREQVQIHLDFEPAADGGTRVAAHGVAPRRVRRSLAGLMG